ncbi:hypothetical protein C5S31_00775 [ANME-1 cluster archaeon GoMg2]|nr:hypothetical protein [ANME-1 cluster archaeon GoMg2]
MNYKYLTKENIIRLHKKIVETTGGEKGMLNEGILSFIFDLIRTEKLYNENIGDLFTRAGLLLRGASQDIRLWMETKGQDLKLLMSFSG